ncbi:BQ5605_C043g12063 [Microbotryum silenes-dioicae]|uniref:BQ5605_C043g12063 protein n=1 Tax=Microbotryum silenes-dioicae TaxID=796604 RepID=A0A2X0NBP4_9BASI|nr:BQ5605_C045g12188 [Microbotryum silenes-dioicae]SGZ32061.1 BQ5605_C043g12063 [Microbotryum silenes-dioicae]
MPHVHNPYADGPPDYSQLAQDVPYFAPFLRTNPYGGSTIDYKDENALRALSSALLERDFGLRIELPRDRLCPIVPGRVEYVTFILRLVHLNPQRSSHVRGLDVGTGASAIYALLVAKMQADAFVYGSEVDEHSQSCAIRNVNANNLTARVQVVCSTREEDPLFPKETWADNELDFTMCNPPFYESEVEIRALATEKDGQPSAVCTGASNEMVTKGGEIEFVGRMIEESVRLGSHIRLSQLIAKLKTHKISNYIVHALSSGRTTRHILVWSLGAWRIPQVCYRPLPGEYSWAAGMQSLAQITPFTTKFSPPVNSVTFRAPSEMDAPTLYNLVCTILYSLDGVKTSHSAPGVIQMRAACNSWSRSARRMARNPTQTGIAGQNTAGTGGNQIEATFTALQDDGEDAGCSLRGEWTQGSEQVRADWLKLWAHVTRKISDHRP